MKGFDFLNLQWSKMKNDNFYEPFDEKRKAILGFWLVKQGIDLDNIPPIFNECFSYFKKSECNNKKFQERKVFLNNITGTSHQDYGNMEIIKSFIRLKRAQFYILNDSVTKIKYTKLLKKTVKEQTVPIYLSQNADGSYYVDGQGNHRVIFYKMMLLSEIVSKNNYILNQGYTLNINSFQDICKKYWLNAYIKTE